MTITAIIKAFFRSFPPVVALGSKKPGGPYPFEPSGSAGVPAAAGPGAKPGTEHNSSGGDYFNEWQKQFSRFIRFTRNDRLMRAKPLPVHLSGPDTIEYIQDLPDSHRAKIALLSALHTKDKASLYEQINKAGAIEDSHTAQPAGNDEDDNDNALMDSGDSADAIAFVKLASQI